SIIDDMTSSPTNFNLIATRLPVFECPSNSESGEWQIEPHGGGSPIATLSIANYVGLFGHQYVGPLPSGGSRDLHACEHLAAGQQCLGDGVFFQNSRVKIGQITDGTSNTIMVGERASQVRASHPPFHSTWTGVIPGGEEAIERILGSTDHTVNSGAHAEDLSSQHTRG